jgi:hypothetical protein
VSNPAIQKDAAWLPDVAAIFAPDFKLLRWLKGYVEANPGVDEDRVHEAIDRVGKIVHNHVGIIELTEDYEGFLAERRRLMEAETQRCA